MIGSSEIAIFIGFIFWVLIISLAGLFIIKLVNRNKTRGHEGKSALDIAKEIYAKGEITKEEFEEIKNTLISM
jgi:putative membrane protein